MAQLIEGANGELLYRGYPIVDNARVRHDATRAPNADDDVNSGYNPGSSWVNNNTGKAFVCVDSTAGAAVWVETTATGGGGGSGDVTGPASSVDNNLVTFDGTSGKAIQDSGTAISDLATAAQGALADTSVQPGDNVSVLTNDAGYTTNTGDVVGPASSVDNRIATFDGVSGKLLQDSGSLVSDFATSAQGALADTAVQPGDNNSVLTNDSGYIAALINDASPQLGADLDVNGNNIVSTANGNISLLPNGTGNVVLGNFTLDADQTVGAGQDNFVLTYDNASGLISLEASSGGIAAVVDDPSPQLGGNLDLNSNDVTGTGNIDITGNVTASGPIATSGTYLAAATTASTVTRSVLLGTTNASMGMSLVDNGNFSLDHLAAATFAYQFSPLLYLDSASTLRLRGSSTGVTVEIEDGQVVVDQVGFSSASVQTTDATQTTLQTIAIPTDEERVISIRVRGHEDATDDSFWYVSTAGFKNVGGTVSIIGAESASSGNDAGAAAWDVAMNVSGANVLVQVTGEAAHTIDWVTSTEVS